MEARVEYAEARSNHYRTGLWFLAFMQLEKAWALLPAPAKAASRSHSAMSRL
jgi:hypothetical protein